MATKAYFKLLFSEDVFPPSGNVNTNYFIEPKIRPENQENVRGLPDQYSGFSVSPGDGSISAPITKVSSPSKHR